MVSKTTSQQQHDEDKDEEQLDKREGEAADRFKHSDTRSQDTAPCQGDAAARRSLNASSLRGAAYRTGILPFE